MKKKFSLIILVILIIVCSSFSASVQIPSITINNYQSQPFVDVNISFSSEKAFAGYQVSVLYNQQILKLIDIQKGAEVSSFTFMTNTNTPGLIKIAGFNPLLLGVTGNGVLAVLRFQIINPGNSNLTLSSVKLSDASGQSIPCSILSGSIRAGGPTQQPEKPKPDEPKPKEPPKTQPLPPINQLPPVIKPQPVPQKPIEEPQQAFDNLDIDEFLTSLEKTEKPSEPETPKDLPQQKPSNSVTLLVFSEYGNPVPPNGVTTFTKGERVECRIENEILLSETEKVVCTGCEGKGSAYNTKNNFLSFVIEKDSKIVWKWKKIKIEPDFLIDTPQEVKINSEKKEVFVPIKLRPLGGFDKSVFLTCSSDFFDVVLPETFITKEKKETTLMIKNKENLYSGQYILTILSQSEDKKITKKTDINVVVYSTLIFEEKILDETSKTVIIPVKVNGNIKTLSSFEIALNAEKNIKFLRIEPAKDVKILSGYTQKGNVLKISGGIIPALEVKNEKIFNLVFTYDKTFSKDMIKLVSASIWNEKGKPVPVIPQNK